MEQIDGVASAEISGGQEKCVRVSVSADRLEAYGLSLASVIQALKAQNLSSSAGIIQSDETNYTISADGAAMIQPINLTVLGGLGFGTVMTLFIMPAVYYVFNRRGEKKRAES
ncbi:MAG: efflux RND transporter permease subunit [Treponema sp.]|nr:efflux RND transporter permease subunit [Treponema sp.]